MTQADKTGNAKRKDKTFYLASPTKQERDEWVIVFSQLIKMTPGERKQFKFKSEAAEPTRQATAGDGRRRQATAAPNPI